MASSVGLDPESEIATLQSDVTYKPKWLNPDRNDSTGPTRPNRTVKLVGVKGTTYNREQFVDRVRDTLGESCLEAVGPTNAPHIWQLVFKTEENKVDFEREGEFTISGTNITFWKPHTRASWINRGSRGPRPKQTEFKCRLHWIPYAVNMASAVNELEKIEGLTIIRCDYETMVDPGRDHIRTTVRSVIIQTDDVDLIPYYTKWSTKDGRGGKVLVTCQGRPPKCLKCSQSGHMRKDCTTEQCSKCKGWGHNDPGCNLPLNYGKFSSNNNNNMDIDSELITQDDDTKSAATPAPHVSQVNVIELSDSPSNLALEPLTVASSVVSNLAAAHSPGQAISALQTDVHTSINGIEVNQVDPVLESDQPWISTRKRRKRRSKSGPNLAATPSDESSSENEMRNAVTMEDASIDPVDKASQGDSQVIIPPSLDGHGLRRTRRAITNRRASEKQEADQTEIVQEIIQQSNADNSAASSSGISIINAARASDEKGESEPSSAPGVKTKVTVAPPTNSVDIEDVTDSYAYTFAAQVEAANCSITTSCFDSTMDEEEEIGEESEITFTSFSSDCTVSHSPSFFNPTSTPIQPRRARRGTRSPDRNEERDRSRSASRSRSPPVNDELKSSRNKVK